MASPRVGSGSRSRILESEVQLSARAAYRLHLCDFSEEMGWGGVGLFISSASGLLRPTAGRQLSPPYLALAVGITFQVVLQAWINIAVVTSSIPAGSAALPLLRRKLAGGHSPDKSCSTSRTTQSTFRFRKRAGRGRMRRGSTWPPPTRSRSAVSTGEWEASVAQARHERTRSGLPQPVVEPRLTGRLPFHPAARAERERLRRRLKERRRWILEAALVGQAGSASPPGTALDGLGAEWKERAARG